MSLLFFLIFSISSINFFSFGLGTEKELTMLITLDEIIELFYKKVYIKFL